LTDGFTQWDCFNENFPNGEYQFSPTCPPPFSLERGRFQASGDGTWRLQAYSGRRDFGTYRVISANQVEITGQLGTVVWTRIR
jgi:hypothetical protein